MKDERKGISKEQMMKEAKTNAELMKFIKSLTEEEINLIKNRREYGYAKPGTKSWKLALYNDSIRSSLRAIKAKINKSLWNIDNLSAAIDVCKIQLTSKNITLTSDKNMVMTEHELKSYIWQQEMLRDGEVQALPLKLGDMRGYVKFKDVGMQIVMSVEEFDKYVVGIEERLKKYGYKLFEEITG